MWKKIIPTVPAVPTAPTTGVVFPNSPRPSDTTLPPSDTTLPPSNLPNSSSTSSLSTFPPLLSAEEAKNYWASQENHRQLIKGSEKKDFSSPGKNVPSEEEKSSLISNTSLVSNPQINTSVNLVESPRNIISSYTEETHLDNPCRALMIISSPSEENLKAFQAISGVSTFVGLPLPFDPHAFVPERSINYPADSTSLPTGDNSIVETLQESDSNCSSFQAISGVSAINFQKQSPKLLAVFEALNKNIPQESYSPREYLEHEEKVRESFKAKGLNEKETELLDLPTSKLGIFLRDNNEVLKDLSFNCKTILVYRISILSDFERGELNFFIKTADMKEKITKQLREDILLEVLPTICPGEKKIVLNSLAGLFDSGATSEEKNVSSLVTGVNTFWSIFTLESLNKNLHFLAYSFQEKYYEKTPDGLLLVFKDPDREPIKILADFTRLENEFPSDPKYKLVLEKKVNLKTSAYRPDDILVILDSHNNFYFPGTIHIDSRKKIQEIFLEANTKHLEIKKIEVKEIKDYVEKTFVPIFKAFATIDDPIL